MTHICRNTVCPNFSKDTFFIWKENVPMKLSFDEKALFGLSKLDKRVFLQAFSFQGIYTRKFPE